MHCPKSKMDMLRCNQLLDVAEDLIDQNGVVSFRFAQIAKEAQCSNHTLYKFFRSKEDVLVCLFLRNCTSNHMPVFLKENGDLTPMEKAALPALFSLAAVKRSPTFNTLRVVSINSMFWQMASDEKVSLLKNRVNLFWSRLELHIREAQKHGALTADEMKLKEFTQAVYFFLAGILSSYESKLMDDKYLGDKSSVFCRHLAEIFNRYEWNEIATEGKFRTLSDRIFDFLDRSYDKNRNCEHCHKFDGFSECESLPNI
ncbi:TetR/AcrR family transcriptional regulator [Ferrimonas aestuarii]|uniref:TetR/AcrR family transcriptional regulator n=2 Tax=Ferrimonas aestuarii TaxID=2569539 RepID=A0A4U1BQJ9_9GAMM|nr:TetR/AcrR family transcriptional regulator [Ferrimonas aestuarii]